MEEYNQEAVDAFANAARPIPGESLTDNPDEPRPFKRPPEFTNFKKALEFTAVELMQEENYMPLMAAIGEGVPILDLTTQIGYVGFREGKWNPDLMLMLIEPVMYLLMALAEKAGINYRIDSEDDIDEDEDSLFEERTQNIANTIKKKIEDGKTIPAGALPKDIMEEIEQLEMPSLLSKPETEEMVEEPISLLQQQGS
jgi:hypothetical protein